jgi:hypothetical protein
VATPLKALPGNAEASVTTVLSITLFPFTSVITLFKGELATAGVPGAAS